MSWKRVALFALVFGSLTAGAAATLGPSEEASAAICCEAGCERNYNRCVSRCNGSESCEDSCSLKYNICYNSCDPDC